MQPSRRTQPYRRGQRSPGLITQAMVHGRPAYLGNPADFQRRLKKLLKALRV